MGQAGEGRAVNDNSKQKKKKRESMYSFVGGVLRLVRRWDGSTEP
jgi:hypothetical protein